VKIVLLAVKAAAVVVAVVGAETTAVVIAAAVATVMVAFVPVVSRFGVKPRASHEARGFLVFSNFL